MAHGVIEGLLVMAAAVGGPAVDPVSEAIRLRIEAGGEPAAIRIEDEPVHASLALPRFYERNGFRPVWSGDGGLLPRAGELLDAIAEADRQGLRPADYHLEVLRGRVERARGPEHLAGTDLLLSDAFLVLAAHLVSGRVDPATFDPTWIATRREVDVAAVLGRVAAGESPRRALRDLRPRHAGYDRLVEALARYRGLAAAGGWPGVGTGASIKPGADDPAVADLRRRLVISGDLDGSEDNGSERLDEDLVEAVIRFQQRHGLDADGVIGPKTREALNVGVARRIRSIELNLERWRWLPQDLGERHLLVNVPDFRLSVTEAGEEVLSMRVIVGRPVRSTPVFSDLMRYLVFSPSWEVPPTILRQDKLPAIRKNPAVAGEQNFRVFQLSAGQWAEVDPLAVDWSKATAGTIRLRQRPGPNNALGRVKFMFPNAFNVYLHDTPSRELFARTQRDFSSGCIRLEQPLELAVYLLRDDPNWTREAIVAAMESDRERSVNLPRPIPVHLQYWTARADPDGRVEFRRDLYGRDPKLDAALKLPPPDEPGS